MSIVPYGYYSLREVFNKIGKIVFSDEWKSDTASFNEEIKNSYYTISGACYSSETKIHPINEDLLIMQVQSFTSYAYTGDEIEKLSNVFLSMHNMHKEESRKKEEERRKKLKRNMARSPYSSAAAANTPDKEIKTLQPDKTEVTELQILNNEKDKGLIIKGIRYAHIAKGLKQIINGELLKSVIIDEKSGKQQALPKEFWIASKSKISFGTSHGIYKHIYSYPMTFNGNKNYYTGSMEYNGLIILKCEEVDKFIEDWAAKNKPITSKAGRKSKISWKRFNSEAMQRLSSDDIENLTKQDAIAEDMKTWCKETFGEDVGLSTIKGKLKPIYDLLKEEA